MFDIVFSFLFLNYYMAENYELNLYKINCCFFFNKERSFYTKDSMHFVCLVWFFFYIFKFLCYHGKKLQNLIKKKSFLSKTFEEGKKLKLKSKRIDRIWIPAHLRRCLHFSLKFQFIFKFLIKNFIILSLHFVQLG